MDPLNPYLLLTLALFTFILYLLLQPHPTTDLARWLQKKNYQYEVTTSLYMLTPTEKFVFSKSCYARSTTKERGSKRNDGRGKEG